MSLGDVRQKHDRKAHDDGCPVGQSKCSRLLRLQYTRARRWWWVGFPRRRSDERWIESATGKCRCCGDDDGVWCASRSRKGQLRWLGAQAEQRCRECAGAVLGVVRSGRVASGPASKAMEKRGQEQRGRNGRSGCRLSAGACATMHPQCTEVQGLGCQERGRCSGSGGGVER